MYDVYHLHDPVIFFTITTVNWAKLKLPYTIPIMVALSEGKVIDSYFTCMQFWYVVFELRGDKEIELFFQIKDWQGN